MTFLLFSDMKCKSIEVQKYKIKSRVTDLLKRTTRVKHANMTWFSVFSVSCTGSPSHAESSVVFEGLFPEARLINAECFFVALTLSVTLNYIAARLHILH
jgi:hypothetical protein